MALNIPQGDALRAIRKIIGVTQAEFAAMVGALKDAVASCFPFRAADFRRSEVAGRVAQLVDMAPNV